ncbi:protein tyrosine phosphatase [Martelella lutilitoris]|uniref:Protein tyrosine phosphatase n=1 Tax=Martelella lutilitoris TaxID=2583532 RepID=A0A7T7KJQ6_9HYPH|nr:protein tyrosine phosphatase [Martelella lutilitoris]QQM28836.1 protein tyrosine phosphatase [Martelella lutilitoris]
MSSAIVVSPLARIGEMAARHKCRSMLSLMANGHDFSRPGVIDPARHLTLRMNDIAFAGSGKLVAPEASHVEEIIRFARVSDGPLLVHCWMGVSRSPAAALIAALARAPLLDDLALAKALRAASPFATPNARLIALGDEALDRKGRLAEAVSAIGRGRDCQLNLPFVLEPQRLFDDGGEVAAMREFS